ncbi:MAG TPA: hypothetical protein VFW25_01220 [Silvibacterium sp.]|nr:hypothetical protein [Silvibacterium sp.]
MQIVTVEACGPDFSPDVFVRTDSPENRHTFAEGHLGILQTDYDSSDLAVAYRYLNGGKLAPQEQQAYAPPPQPVQDWTHLSPQQLREAQAAQSEVEEEAAPEFAWRHALEGNSSRQPMSAGESRQPQAWAEQSLYYNPDYPNCTAPAFRMAALTLARRTQTWGRKSLWLVDWINAQQAVFSNCNMKSRSLPSPAPPGSPALLKADRAYQDAAAQFYAGNYDLARQGFEAIALDHISPWHMWGGFLAARAEVRAAFAAGPKTDPWSNEVAGFSMPLMQRAQQMLQLLLAQHDPGLPRRVILQELSFIRLRTQPGVRFEEICAALTGPRTDDNFDQDLKDLSYLITKAPTHNSPPLYAWIASLRSSNPVNALLAWKQTPSLPWLVAALMRAQPTDPSASELLRAAQRVRPDSPAWETVTFHRVRLLTGIGRSKEARALLEEFLPEMRRQAASSALNGFLAERMSVASTFPEFLEFAPRTVLRRDSEGAWYDGMNCPPFLDEPYKEACVPDHPVEFDADAAAVLNRTPIRMLIEAANSTQLPANLREEVAAAAWTRSVVLDDEASVAKLASLLPATLHASSSDSVGFSAVMIILRNPGLRPYVEPGISHLNHPGALDQLRDNWWCWDWEQFSGDGRMVPPPSPVPSFYSSQQARAGASEYARVLALPCAPQFLGRRVLHYAKEHPNDPNLPEALALTVRATHYACLSWAKEQKQAAFDNTSVSKAAFEMLHHRFPNSPWTARTKLYY